MNPQKTILVIAALLLASALTASLSFKVYSLSTEYTRTSPITVYANVSNDANHSLSATVFASLASGESATSVSSYEVALPSLTHEIIVLYNLTPGELNQGSYEVTASLESRQGLIALSQTQFSVFGALRETNAIIEACADESCYVKSNLFKQDQTVFLFIRSQQNQTRCGATTTLPSGETISHPFPYSFKITELGTHYVAANCSAPGRTPTRVSLLVSTFAETPLVKDPQVTPEPQLEGIEYAFPNAVDRGTKVVQTDPLRALAAALTMLFGFFLIGYSLKKIIEGRMPEKKNPKKPAAETKIKIVPSPEDSKK